MDEETEDRDAALPTEIHAGSLATVAVISVKDLSPG